MPEIPAIYFSTLEIENVRCFGDRQVLDLTANGRPARWTLLIGENGAGKTTLLECLAWMRPVPEVRSNPDMIAGSSRPGAPAPLLHGMLQPALIDEKEEVLETLPRDGSQGVTVSAKLSFGGGPWFESGPESVLSQPNDIRDIRVGMKLSFDERALLRDIRPRRAQIKKLGSAFDDPLIVSYGANRYLGERESLGVEGSNPLDHERLSKGTELCDIEKILMDLDYAARTDQLEPEVSSLRLLKKVISRILLEDQYDERIEIHPPDVLETGRPSGVYVKTFTGLVRMSALSLGHRTTAGWIMDLAWRFLNRYPDSPDPLAEPAIVLLDEIDLHLHPRWQFKIMNDLSSLFPATQFIATSHSPLIVQVAETPNLVLLRKREGDVEIVNDPGVPRILRVDQILTSLLFGVPSSRSERIQRLFNQRAELVDKSQRSQEEEDRLNHIRRQLNELPTAEDPDDQDAMDLIRKFANRLKNGKVART